MSDAILSGLRERFGIAEGVSDEDFLAAVDAARDPEVTPEIAAAAFSSTPDAITTALAASKPADGAVVLTKDVFDELKIAAAAGAQARKVQLEADRDTTLAGHIAAAHITPGRKDFWAKKWDLDPEGTKAELATLGEPVLNIAASGYSGAPAVEDEDALYAKLYPTQEA